VDSVDANGLELAANINGSQHGGVGGRLFSVGLDLHTTGDAGVGFTAGKIGHVDEGVVEGGLDVTDTKSVVSGLATNLRGSVVGLLLLLLGFFTLLSFCLGSLGL